MNRRIVYKEDNSEMQRELDRVYTTFAVRGNFSFLWVYLFSWRWFEFNRSPSTWISTWINFFTKTLFIFYFCLNKKLKKWKKVWNKEQDGHRNFFKGIQAAKLFLKKHGICLGILIWDSHLFSLWNLAIVSFNKFF